MTETWNVPEEKTYNCRVVIVPEPGGGYSVFMPRLPGCASQGDTVEDAVANITEAFQGVAACYLANGGTIPWTSD